MVGGLKQFHYNPAGGADGAVGPAGPAGPAGADGDSTPARRSGLYYASEMSNFMDAAMTIENIVVTPLPLPDCTLNRIGIKVKVVGGAGSVIRLGIYDTAVDGIPGNLILDAGTVIGDTLGFKEIIINQVIVSGLYWIGSAAQVGTVPQVVSSNTGASRHEPLVGDPIGDTMVSFNREGYSAPGIVGAFPAVFPLSGAPAHPLSTRGVPRVVVRVA